MFLLFLLARNTRLQPENIEIDEVLVCLFFCHQLAFTKYDWIKADVKTNVRNGKIFWVDDELRKRTFVSWIIVFDRRL